MPETPRLCSRCRLPLPEGRRTRMHAECVRQYRAELNSRPASAVRTRGSASATIPSRRFGVEIEFYCSQSFTAVEAALRAAGVVVNNTSTTHNGSSLTAWVLKYDGSLNAPPAYSWHGMELVSPPISGAEGFDALKNVCRVLRTLGARVNRSTGLHVHHDVEDLNLRQFKNVVLGYANNQRSIDQLVATSRRGRQSFCGPLDDGTLTSIRNCPSLGSIATLVGTRYVHVNLKSFPKYGTIELRQHQGSINYTKIAAWISFGQALIAKAKADAEAGELYEVAGFSYVADFAAAATAFLAGLPLSAARRRQLLSRIGDAAAAAA
jgi:hypothetical protein